MKSRNLTQSSLRNDPINRRMQGYSFRIFEDEDGVQDVNSSFSFNQSLILSIQMTRKWVKNTLEQTACEMDSYTRRIWWIIANRSSCREERIYKRRNRFVAVGWRWWSRWTIVIARSLIWIAVLIGSSDLDPTIVRCRKFHRKMQSQPL